jgi:hypothetical protein
MWRIINEGKDVFDNLEIKAIWKDAKLALTEANLPQINQQFRIKVKNGMVFIDGFSDRNAAKVVADIYAERGEIVVIYPNK